MQPSKIVQFIAKRKRIPYGEILKISAKERVRLAREMCAYLIIRNCDVSMKLKAGAINVKLERFTEMVRACSNKFNRDYVFQNELKEIERIIEAKKVSEKEEKKAGRKKKRNLQVATIYFPKKDCHVVINSRNQFLYTF